MEKVTIIRVATLPDHAHMYVSIPPKECVGKVVEHIKGKSSLKLFDMHPEYKDRYVAIFGREDIIVRLSVM